METWRVARLRRSPSRACRGLVHLFSAHSSPAVGAVPCTALLVSADVPSTLLKKVGGVVDFLCR